MQLFQQIWCLKTTMTCRTFSPRKRCQRKNTSQFRPKTATVSTNATINAVDRSFCLGVYLPLHPSSFPSIFLTFSLFPSPSLLYPCSSLSPPLSSPFLNNKVRRWMNVSRLKISGNNEWQSVRFITRHSCTGRYCLERVLLAMGILSVRPSRPGTFYSSWCKR